MNNLNGVHVVLTVAPKSVDISIGVVDIMGRVVDTIRATNPITLNILNARATATGQLVLLAIEHGATSIEIIIEEG